MVIIGRKTKQNKTKEKSVKKTIGSFVLMLAVIILTNLISGCIPPPPGMYPGMYPGIGVGRRSTHRPRYVRPRYTPRYTPRRRYR